ncbi:cholesterol 24-hydroxylase-like [Nelusetta ayraudi]|uniref:cholesterol 24-hydroxylase-like n=1 Tax=Nelusetta ayraudi TaxID=303726 RepID=UPI003F72B329
MIAVNVHPFTCQSVAAQPSGFTCRPAGGLHLAGEMAFFSMVLNWAAYGLLLLLIPLSVAFLGYCLYIKSVHMKYDHIPGPPRDSFFFGNALKFLSVMRKGDLVHDLLLEWRLEYGPVCKINFLHDVLILVTCPEATKEILMSPKYSKDSFLHNAVFTLFGQRFLGNGLVSVRHHEEWYKQRRIMDPAFSSLYLRGLSGTFNERAERLMDKLTELADSKTDTSMLSLVNSVTLDVIAKVAFGVDLDLLNHSSPFPRAIETCLKGMVINIRDKFFAYNPMNRPFINEVREACRLLRHTGAEWINNRKAAIQNGDEVPKDILTQIIKTVGKDTVMTPEDEEFMLDNFVTFFIAGQETTANQLAFCIMELGRHPDILEKAKKEVDEVIGMKQEISYEDLSQLVYLSQVLKETLRLYPPATGTSRDVVEDIDINGIRVPKGGIVFACHSVFFSPPHTIESTQTHKCLIDATFTLNCFVMQLSTYVTGRMEEFFPDPMKFDPDRFHPDAPKLPLLPGSSLLPGTELCSDGSQDCDGQVAAEVRLLPCARTDL